LNGDGDCDDTLDTFSSSSTTTTSGSNSSMTPSDCHSTHENNNTTTTTTTTNQHRHRYQYYNGSYSKNSERNRCYKNTKSKRVPKTIRRRGANFITKSATVSNIHTRTIHTNSNGNSTSVVQKQHNHDSPKHVTSPSTSSVTNSPTMTSTTTTTSSRESNGILTQRGIGIDTRYLQTFVGDAISQNFRSLVYEFLYTCADSGLLPSILSSTTRTATDTTGSSNTHLSASSAGNNIQCQGTRLYFHMLHKEHLVDTIIPPVSVTVSPHANMNEPQESSTFFCPTELNATESWIRLEELVNSILMETSKGSNTRPVDITIVTNDAAFFVDTNIDSHKSGACHFWNRMRTRFNTNQVKSIHIACFCTGVDVLSANATGEFDPSVLSAWSTTSCASSVESLELSTVKCLKEDLSASSSPKGEACEVPHRFRIHLCAKAIAEELTSLNTKESNMPDYVSMNPMDIKFSFHDCHMIQFENLLRSWTRETFSTSCPKGRISFDLPETLDGTQCSITLDLSYQMLPFQVNSLATDALVEDMKMISNSTFSVVQLVPLDQVDISLIYGVPFVAKAGLEGDIDQYKEIQRLYNELLKYLLTKDCGLVLCSETYGRMGAFKDTPEKNLFLLMAQESDVEVEKSRDVLLKGTLHRYCRKSSQILEPDSMSHAVISYDGSNIDVYSEVVKNALEFIPTAVINPSSFGSTETC
jgi:hypothetical protein